MREGLLGYCACFSVRFFFALAHTALQMNQEIGTWIPFSFLEMLILVFWGISPPPHTHNKSKPWNSFEKHQGLPLINFSFHLALTQCWKHVVQFSFKWKLLTWIHEGSSFFSSLSLFPTLPLRGRFRFKFFLTFYCEAFKDTEKWKECFSEHLYTHHLFYILLNSLHNTPFHLAVFSIHSLNLSFRLCYTSPKHFSMHVIT